MKNYDGLYFEWDNYSYSIGVLSSTDYSNNFNLTSQSIIVFAIMAVLALAAVKNAVKQWN